MRRISKSLGSRSSVDQRFLVTFSAMWAPVRWGSGLSNRSLVPATGIQPTLSPALLSQLNDNDRNWISLNVQNYTSHAEIKAKFPSFSTQAVNAIHDFMAHNYQAGLTALQSPLPPKKVAGVPWDEITKNVPVVLSPKLFDGYCGVRAWTYYTSRLAEQGITGRPLPYYESRMYHGLTDFVQTFARSNPDGLINQDRIFRGTHVLALPKVVQQKSFEEGGGEELLKLFQNPPPTSSLAMNAVTPNPNGVPDDFRITFSTLTSWTYCDLTTAPGAAGLAKYYPASMNVNVIFVATNARDKYWGSAIGSLSFVPGEKEILIPPTVDLRITSAAYWRRPTIPNPRGTGIVPSALIHVIYVTFVDDSDTIPSRVL